MFLYSRIIFSVVKILWDIRTRNWTLCYNCTRVRAGPLRTHCSLQLCPVLWTQLTQLYLKHSITTPAALFCIKLSSSVRSNTPSSTGYMLDASIFSSLLINAVRLSVLWQGVEGVPDLSPPVDSVQVCSLLLFFNPTAFLLSWLGERGPQTDVWINFQFHWAFLVHRYIVFLYTTLVCISWSIAETALELVSCPTCNVWSPKRII